MTEMGMAPEGFDPPSPEAMIRSVTWSGRGSMRLDRSCVVNRNRKVGANSLDPISTSTVQWPLYLLLQLHTTMWRKKPDLSNNRIKKSLYLQLTVMHKLQKLLKDTKYILSSTLCCIYEINLGSQIVAWCNYVINVTVYNFDFIF